MAIDQVVTGLAKKYGITIGHLSGDDSKMKVPYIPTGLISLDMALGVGGIPLGCVVEIFAPEGVGKTTLCLQIVAQAQAAGLQVAYIDMEHRIDPKWASTLGVDLETLYFTQPPYGEAALNIAGALIKGGIRLVVIDSVPALVPKAEYDGETGDQFVGLQPRMIAQYLRQTAHSIKTFESTIIFINQIRARIGGMSSLSVGPAQTQPGGWALRHNASVRIDMRRIKTLKNGEEPYGQRVLLSVVKNSLAIPYRSTELTLRYGRGFDAIEGLIDLGINLGLIERSGSWYSIAGREEKAQGREAVYDILGQDNALMEAIDGKIRGILLGEQEHNKDTG